MKIYLQNIVNELKMFSESLDKQTLLVNKPWALIDSDLGIQKLIFKKNNELIMSKDGQVNLGKWDYLPEAKCLLIDRGIDKILCNETYIDESILVLKVDGKGENFIVLANENNIPDLDAYGYLHMLYQNKYNILIKYLDDERIMKIIPNFMQEIGLGSKVSIDNNTVDEGEFITKDKREKIIVSNNKIIAIKYLKKYKLYDNNFLLIEQNYSNNLIEAGSKVTLNDQFIKSDSFIVDSSRQHIFVENSIIIRITYLITYSLKSKSKITIEQIKDFNYTKGDLVWINNNLAPDGKYNIPDNSEITVKDGVIIKIGLSNELKNSIILGSIILIIIFFAILIDSMIN
jgi:hypothetical protein